MVTMEKSRNRLPNAVAPSPIARNMRTTVTPPRATRAGCRSAFSSGGQHLTLMHRGERPQKPGATVRQNESADEPYGTISSGGSPDAPPKGGIAMMPAARGLENAVRSVFLIVPRLVPMTMKRWPSSSGNSWTRRMSAIFSPSFMLTRLAIDLPLLRPTSGTS